ncbi:MAG: OmpA family protein [Ignavibacteriota bacterium]|nr:OmpA family protein [Ignavibacteriaceae bacterium]QKJ95574.1 MAG: OmpA family protein [Ignavibacteriota bacterium]
MKFTFTILLFTLLFSSFNYTQTVQTQRYNPFSGTVVFSVEGGTTLASTDYSGLGVDYLGRLSIEYFFPARTKSGFGIRAFYNAGFLTGSDSNIDPHDFRTNISTIGAGVIFNLSVNDVAFPYFFAGIASLSFNPKGEGGVELPNNAANVYSTTEVNYLGELGARYPVTENLSVSLSFGLQISPNDWLDDKAIGVGNDMFFTAMGGISYSFLTEFDTDGDGVVDSKDMCANTPAGVKVDEFGCPFDSDKDGIPDYLDECSGTPQGAPVDKKGCPLDSDNDGVPDYTDLCPDTTPGVKVDEYGCPFDSDGDGVPDHLDRCPDTPYEIQVDKNGCPMDEDLDGVPDHLDQCPGTLPGVQVDENGCELVIAPPPPPVDPNQLILNSETSFEFNSAQLKPAAFPELDKMLEQMKKYPMSRWRIEGHTDNIGSEDGNIKMSQMRAESVLNYFVSRGIPQIRFEVAGMGSKSPIADNKTEEGRAKNRRVEITRIDK